MKNKNRLDNSLKLLAKSSYIVFIGVFLSKIFSYVYTIIIAREFGKEIYGLFSLAVMVSGIFILFSSMGIGEGLTRYIPLYRGKKQKEKIKYLVRKSAKVFLITGIISTILLIILSRYISNNLFNEPNLYTFLIIFSLTIPINLFITILLSSLKGYEHVGWYSFLSNILATFAHLALILILLYLGIGVYSITLSYLFGSLMLLFFSFFITKKQIPEIFQKSRKIKDKSIIKEVVMYSFPLFLAGMAWKIFKWADSFVIGFFKSAADVGSYNAAVPIAMLLAISSQLFMQLFFPLITRFYSQGDKSVIKEITQQVSKWIFMINLPFLVLFILFPSEFIVLFFGKEYVSASSALVFLSIGIFSLSFFDMSYRLIAMKGLSKILLMDILSISIVNVILNIILVPILGITGAAIATMFSYIVLSVIIIYQSARYLSIIPLARKMANVLVAALTAAAILFFVKNIVEANIVSFIILSIFFLLLYCVLVFLFKGLDKRDFMIISASFKKINPKSWIQQIE